MRGTSRATKRCSTTPPGRLALGPLDARRDVRVEGAPLRDEHDAIEAELAGRLVHERDVAVVVGEEVLLRDVLDAPRDLEHVARRERREGERLRARVVVEPVPGLARALLGLVVRVDDGAVRLVDARPLDLHLLAVGVPGDRAAPERVRAALR